MAAGNAPRIERAASFLSFVCAAHCLALPLLSAAAPLMSLGALTAPATELAMTISVVAIAVFSALMGYRRHRDARVPVSVGIALVVYVVGHALEANWVGRLAGVVGALLLAAALFAGARLSSSHSHAHAHCSH